MVSLQSFTFEFEDDGAPYEEDEVSSRSPVPKLVDLPRELLVKVAALACSPALAVTCKCLHESWMLATQTWERQHRKTSVGTLLRQTTDADSAELTAIRRLARCKKLQRKTFVEKSLSVAIRRGRMRTVTRIIRAVPRPSDGSRWRPPPSWVCRVAARLDMDMLETLLHWRDTHLDLDMELHLLALKALREPASARRTKLLARLLEAAPKRIMDVLLRDAVRLADLEVVKLCVAHGATAADIMAHGLPSYALPGSVPLRYYLMEEHGLTVYSVFNR